MPVRDDNLVVRECGTRHQGCDESSGWIWHSARCLDEHLTGNLHRYLRQCCCCCQTRRQPQNETRLRSTCAESHRHIRCGRKEEESASDGDAASADEETAQGKDGSPPLPLESQRSERRSCCCGSPPPSSRSYRCWKGLRILELGSGTGWLAMRLASRGAVVTATDRPGAVPLLTRNVLRNQELLLQDQQWEEDDYDRSVGGDDGDSDDGVTVEGMNVQVRTLEWDSAMPNDSSESDQCPDAGGYDDAGGVNAGSNGDGWDVIVASDVLYVKESHRPLLETIRQQSRRAVISGCSDSSARRRPTLVVIAWEQRHPGEEADFQELATGLFGLVGLPGTPREIGTCPGTGNPICVAAWAVL